MKIIGFNPDSYRVNQPSENRPTPAARQAREADKAGEPDKVSLSPRSRELLALRKQLEESPEVREALVADLRRQVQEGTYRPDARQIATKMLDELKGLVQE